MDLDLQGRTAKAHIEKWQQYGEKAEQHKTSAAIILSEVRGLCEKNGQWGAWLDKYEIKSRTASRILLEYASPESREHRQAKDRQAKADDRELLRKAKANRPESGRKVADKPLKTHETYPEDPDLQTAIAAVKALSTIQFDTFKRWFREYSGGAA